MTTPYSQQIRTRNIAMGSAAVLIAGLGYFIWSDIAELRQTKADADIARASAARAQADIKGIPRAEEDVLVVRESVKRYVAILPDDKDINKFVDRLTSFATDAGVKIVKLDDQDARARTQRGAKAATEAFDRVSYKLSMTCSTESLLKFMDLFENHQRFVRIPVFKINRGQDVGRSQDVTALVPNDVDMEIETYVYNSTVRQRDPVVIPDEAKKVEGLAKRGVLAKVNADPIIPASWRHDPSMMRRDVFVDPRRVAAQMDSKGETTRLSEEVELEQVLKALSVATAAVNAEGAEQNVVKRAPLKTEAERHLAALGARVEDIQSRNGFAVVAVRTRFEREVIAPYETMMRARGQVPSSVNRAQLEALLARVREAMNDHRHDEAAALADQALAMRSGSDSALTGLFDELTREARIARAHVEFSSIDLVCLGTIVPHDRPDRAVAILNGMPVAPQEGVPGRPDITVKSISVISVTFLYKGVAIERAVNGLSQKSSGTKVQTPTSPQPKKKN